MSRKKETETVREKIVREIIDTQPMRQILHMEWKRVRKSVRYVGTGDAEEQEYRAYERRQNEKMKGKKIILCSGCGEELDCFEHINTCPHCGRVYAWTGQRLKHWEKKE